ncbi:MAG TPA: L,D-transpeptidase [Chthoniobacterales bacterium]
MWKWIFAVLGTWLYSTSIGQAQYAIDIDLTTQRAYLLYHERAILESPISSGRVGHATPTGSFQVTDKDVRHTSSIYGRIVDRYGRAVVRDADVDMPTPAGTRFVNAPMRYYMQFAPGIGLHAGYLPGYPASHACVRMPEDKAIAFFQAVQVGTPVTVFGSAPRVRQYEASNRTYGREPAAREFYLPGTDYNRPRRIIPPDSPFGFW